MVFSFIRSVFVKVSLYGIIIQCEMHVREIFRYFFFRDKNVHDLYYRTRLNLLYSTGKKNRYFQCDLHIWSRRSLSDKSGKYIISFRLTNTTDWKLFFYIQNLSKFSKTLNSKVVYSKSLDHKYYPHCFIKM